MASLWVLLYFALAVSTAAKAYNNCPRWVGTYRDCTCGIMHRESEEICCTDQTCFEPRLIHDTLACPFRCENGGKFNTRFGGCECKEGYHGLCCERETLQCGDTFFAPSGNFSSPGYPLRYPNQTRCVWKIATDPERRITLSTVNDEFEVEEGTSVYSCNHDWLSVYDGEDKSARRIGSYCGNGMRRFQTVQSTGRFLYIEFVSDWQREGRGFHLQYTSFYHSEPCGLALFGLPTGVINSPQYPLNYGPNRRCTYEIRVKPRHYLILSTLDMNIPATADCSGGDRILVSRGSLKRRIHLTVLCGKNLFAPYIIRGARRILLDFTSDYMREGRFQLQYQQIPST